METRGNVVKVDLTKYDRNTLEDEFVKVSSKVNELEAKLKWYEGQMRLANQKKYGASSEKTDTDSGQIYMFNEAELEASDVEPEPELKKIHKRGVRKKGNKEYLTEDLPVEVIEYKLSAEEQTCPECQGPMHEMSKEIRKELKVIPAQVMVTQHIRYVYACRQCEKEGITVPIITAPMPKPVIPNSLASPSLISFIMTRKYEQALPLYRQEQQFHYYGLEIKRQNLANWMIYSSEHHLTHLYKRMHELLIAKEVIHADETTIQVLNEDGKTPESKSYMWMYRTTKGDDPIVLYEYQPGRSARYPVSFLKGFRGYVHVDGYEAYGKLLRGPDGEDTGVRLVGCLAHSRRKWDEALKSLPKGVDSSTLAAKKGLSYCNKLFDLERKFENYTPEKRYLARIKYSKPLLDDYFEWALKENAVALPKGPLGKALTYNINQRAKLEGFLLDGRLELSNNRAERAIKPFVIGRKNWTFANCVKGAQSSAVIYSIIETAKASKLHTFNYITYLLEQLPNIDVTDNAELDKLLPWMGQLPESCYCKKK